MQKSLYSPEHEAFVGLLRDLRTERGISQVELARRLGEEQPFISRYEVGGRRLDFVEVWRICGALGVSLQEVAARFEAAVRETRQS